MAFNNSFLKPTPLYKEYAILELLSKDSNVTQRVIASSLNSSLSMINQYLEEYEDKGFIKRKYKSVKQVNYLLTKKGILRLRELNIKYLETIRKIYLNTKKDIVKFLYQILKNGFKTILMYGAGEVSELTLQVLLEEESLPLKVKAIIDDDLNKQNTKIMGIDVIPRDKLYDYNVDGILISSYTHNKKIRDNLLKFGYEENKIFDYFSIV